ncbi:MAG: hypothetical protein V4467_04930 [Patescibacteria group bacterium]
MDEQEARQVLDAFLSGYVELTHPELAEAGKILGKKARILSFPGFSQPQMRNTIRIVVNARDSVPDECETLASFWILAKKFRF